MPTRPTPYASIRFLFIGSRLCLHASFRRLLAESPLRFAITYLHQVVKGTFTLELLDMLGTHDPAPAELDSAFIKIVGIDSLDLVRCDRSDSDTVIDHELGERGTVDEDDSRIDPRTLRRRSRSPRS